MRQVSVLLILFYFASLATSCTEQERSSLLEFITELSYDGGLISSWENITDCCKWEGITCSLDMTVTGVTLASRRLQGHISASLGNLNGLLCLNLSHNLLSGTIPLELMSSKSIVVLDVSFNQLNGDLQELQPSALLPLQVLNISSNKFTERFPSSPWEVMKSLVVLNASNNSFTGQIPTKVCFNAPSLVVLELSYNHFSGSIPPELGNCYTLTSLKAGHNNLSGTLPDALFNISSLEHLSLHDNQLEGSLNGISKLTYLVTLDLGRNGLSGNIPDSIGELSRLNELHLDNNRMSGELPYTLSHCKNLKTIDLKVNYFSGELTKVNFSNLPNLKTLDLMMNNLSGKIPESIYACSNLTALRLASNKFHGQVSEEIGNLKSLSFLSLANNSLTNITGALQILSTSSSRNLTTLLIGRNFMHEAMPDDDTINGFGDLQTLDLSHNHLTGAIPTALNNLHFLSQLNISNNNLEGSIPMIGQLSTFPSSSFDGNPKLCGPMLAHHCNSEETIFSTEQTDNKVEKLMFMVAFAAFLCVGVLYDQMVLSKFIG
ncbi:hypothetical protein HU200_043989 [Digitaria exilis]|uniref:Leucine-rich repeat-containing N-terminal plant-type domain-containing protein n=1 Tax=Digitaria exilis TaxID=1010633 RepID=A0A835EEK6_9POAL|nr:hypothetical protein HU200_043989 [Digitaria exilis]